MAWRLGNGMDDVFQAVAASGDGMVILINSQRSWPLIAELLRDWAQWSGVGAVQMSRIAAVDLAVKVLLDLAWLAVPLSGYSLLRAGRANSGVRASCPGRPERSAGARLACARGDRGPGLECRPALSHRVLGPSRER